MRIIAGSLGGRQFDSPGGHRTHPMSDRMRGGLFNALGDIEGLTVLDAFAGSGALSFEAISRGAASSLAIEVDPKAHSVIEANIKALEVEDKVKATRAFTNAWSNRHPHEEFDLVLADPPYDKLPFRDLMILPKHLKPGGTLVLSWPGKTEPYYIPGFTEVKIKDYGDSQLVFYQKTDQ